MSGQIWLVVSDVGIDGGEDVEKFDTFEAAKKAALDYAIELAGDWHVFQRAGHYTAGRPKWKAA